MTDRTRFSTERRLPESMNLDTLAVADAVAVMNAQDHVMLAAVERAASQVAAAVELIVERLARGGRLFYVGAGTSGRLGVLDASECPPTFSTSPDLVQGVIAGGPDAMFRSKEGAEDDTEAGAAEMVTRGVNERDVVVGIAAGGTTPFVHGALRAARATGAGTAFLCCVESFANEPIVDVMIRVVVGPEVLTGSTRLKAGTATKLILNQLSTLTMVRLGKCYENLMVDLRASNAKLRDRATRIVSTIAAVSNDEAGDLLTRAGGEAKTAIVMKRWGCDAAEARKRLKNANGQLRRAIAPLAPQQRGEGAA